jgi:endogenous inhibitor of DNA gyrase (YacG/DUF329 family)
VTKVMGKKFKNVGKVVPLKKSRCPICGKPPSDQTKPFCSSHCANLDLGHWLDGKYRVPTDEVANDSTFDVIEDD